MVVNKNIIECRLQVNTSAKPKKQKLYKMSDDKVATVKSEVERLLDARFICEVQYPRWLVNVVMVKKMANGECVHTSVTSTTAVRGMISCFQELTRW
jgi:hypothetical protein